MRFEVACHDADYKDCFLVACGAVYFDKRIPAVPAKRATSFFKIEAEYCWFLRNVGTKLHATRSTLEQFSSVCVVRY